MIQIAYPDAPVLGGVLALHQLHDALRDLGHDARLVNIGQRFPDPDPDGTVVVPEIWPMLTRYPGIENTVFWWLGWRELPPALHPSTVHAACGEWTQARVADAYGAKVHRLDDYLAADFHGLYGDVRRPIVLMNSRSAVLFPVLHKALEPHGVHVRMIPESRPLAPEQVATLLRETSVYVEAGTLTGMDRTAREAALCGAVVFATDDRNGREWPLPWWARIRPQTLDDLPDQILAVVRNRPLFMAEQEEFRLWCANAEHRFRAQVEALFGRP